MNATLKAELDKESQRIEEDALFSGKGHYNAVPHWRWGHRLLGTVSAVASTMAAISVLKQWGAGWAVGGAAISTVAAVVLTTLKPNDEADRHQRAGDRYFEIKNRARIFRVIELLNSTASEEDLIAQIKAMSEGLSDVRSGAPTIPSRAYRKARREIEVEKTAEHRVDRDSSD